MDSFDSEGLEKTGRELHFVEKQVENIRNYIRTRFPDFYQALYDSCPTSQTMNARKRYAFVIGSLYGCIIFYCSVKLIDDIPDKALLLIFSFLVMLMSSVMTYFPGLRCLLTIVIFNVLTGSGKVVLTKNIISNLSNGPLDNAKANLRSIGRTLTCNFELFQDLTRAENKHLQVNNKVLLDSLRNEQFNENYKSVQEMNAQNLQVVKGFYDGDDVNEKIIDPKRRRRETEEDKNIKSQKVFQSTLVRDCHKISKQPSEQCHDRFKTKSAENECRAKVKNLEFSSIQSATRWTIDIFSKEKMEDMCAKPSDGMCEIEVNPMSAVCNNSSSYFDGSIDITEIKKQTLDFNAEFNTSTDDLKLMIVLKPVEPIRLDNLTHIQVASIMGKFKMQYGYRYLNWCLQLVQLLISFSFFIMFVNSYKYYKAYLTDIRFDNACITQRFRDIDARRLDEKRTLLPLKNFEQDELHYPLDMHVSAYQKPNFLIKMYAKVGLMVLSLLLLLFDWILTDFLSIFKEHSVVSFAFEAESEMVYNVSGTGYLANLLRNVTQEIHEKNEKLVNGTNQDCELSVIQLQRRQYVDLGQNFVWLIISMLLEFYVKRLNKVICQFYFDNWEQKRIIWLYNDRLRKRIQYIARQKKKIIEDNATLYSNNPTISTDSTSNNTSRYFNWCLNLMGAVYSRYETKKCCELCKHEEGAKSHVCEKCCLIYCQECWLDLEQACVRCDESYTPFIDNYYSENYSFRNWASSASDNCCK